MAASTTEMSLSDLPDDIGISYLNEHVSLRRKQKARSFVNGSYIETLNFYRDGEEKITIKGEVYPSVKKNDNRHIVNIEVNTNDKVIVDAYCRCQIGSGGTCSHILAVLYMVEQWKIAGYKDKPALLSSTSLPQQWDKPRGGKIKAEPVSHMVMASPLNMNRKRKPVTTEFTDNRLVQVKNEELQALKQRKQSPISYLIEEPDSNTTYANTHIGPQVVGSGLSYHADLMKSVHEPRTEYGCGDIDLPLSIQLDDATEKILSENAGSWTEMILSSEEANTIEKKTRLQSNCKDWHEERKTRITASVFGSIMKRQKTVNECFMRNTFRQKSFISKPTTYGHVHEKTAKVIYIKKTGSHLHDVGLVVNPKFPFLGASPDGLVCSGGRTGLVEVKCPYSARNYSVQEAIENNVKDFCLIQNGEEIEINTKHPYYYQVQGQLLVTGLPFCDFIVYSNDDIFVKRIKPDPDTMLCILKKMTDFYVKEFKPYIQSVAASEVN